MRNKNCLEKIVSVTNKGTNKVVSILGYEIKLRNKHKENIRRIDELEQRLHEKEYQINSLRNALGGVTPSAYLQYVEVHLTDHCNLNCKACEHYCPLVDAPTFTDIEEFTADMRELSSKVTVEKIRLMGGEPLLHPDVNSFITITRKYFRHSDIHLVTNGILLQKMSAGFWCTLRENDIFLDISKYPPLKDKYDFYRQLANENQVKLGYSKIADEFWCSLNPNGDSDANESFSNCWIMRNCHNLRHGRVMLCPEACYMDIYNKYFNENIPRDTGIDIYENSGEKIVEYLNTPKETCRYCKPFGRIFEWGISTKDKTEWDANARV